MRLTDKVALVTGSTTGIGESIARRFAVEGARVVVHGLDTAEGESVVGAIRAKGGEAHFVRADLSEVGQCEYLIAAVIERYGRLDILVNNAAVITQSNLDSTDADTFDITIAVNLRAPLLLIRAATPHFRAQGGGRVLNIGSVNAYCGERGLLAYSISKGGLTTMTRNLADALGEEGIRVNQFNPGWILTKNEDARKIEQGMPEDWASQLPVTTAPSGRLIAPDEIAHFALAFVDDDAALINGSVVELEQYPIIGRNPPKSTA